MKNEFLSFPRSAKLYLSSQFLLAGYYTWPFWFGFAMGRISASQFGFYLAISYIVGLIAEIPTGAFADNLGRKQSALLGVLLVATVPLTVYFGGNFNAYIIAAIIGGIGSAFISGSLESHLYELPEVDKTKYRKIIIQETFFWQSGLIFSAALGGLMYRLMPILPFIVQTLSFVIAAYLIWLITTVDQKTKQQNHQTLTKRIEQYIRTNKEGFLHLFQKKALWPLLVFGSTLSMVMWMSIENLNEAGMIHYGLAPAVRGLYLAGAKVIALIIMFGLILKKLKTDNQKLLYLCLMTICVFTFYSFGIKSIFLIGFIAFNLISSVMDNFIRPIIHDHLKNQWRATAMSSYSFICNLYKAIASVALGFVLQQNGIVFVQRIMLLMFIVVALPALGIFLNLHRNQRSPR